MSSVRRTRLERARSTSDPSRGQPPTGARPAEALRIRVFGVLEVRRGELLLPAFPTEKSRSLFAYLVVNRGRLLSRDRLMGTFWGDRPDAVARKHLRTEIWRVRTVIEPKGLVDPGTYVHSRDHSFSFDPQAPYWLDLEEFERRLAGIEALSSDALAAEEERLLREAVSICRGDLLEGVYDEWCVFEQERTKQSLCRALRHLVQHFEREKRWPEAVEYAGRLLEYAPLRESVHRDVMRYHYHAGDRAAALQQFQTCVRLLGEELDIGPMRETLELRDAIRAEALTCDLPTRFGPGAPDGREPTAPEGGSEGDASLSALRRLNDVADDLDRARARLQRGIADVERIDRRRS